MVAVPFCHFAVSRPKPRPSAYPADLTTLGDHIRKRRLDLGLLQKEVAWKLGVTVDTITYWENNRTSPSIKQLPKVIDFLEYDPRPPGRTVGEKLRRHREGPGLSWAEAADVMGVDPATVTKWERRPDEQQNHVSIPKIAHFLGSNPLPEPQSEVEELRQWRLLAGLTQRELAGRLGVTQQRVSEWESGSE